MLRSWLFRSSRGVVLTALALALGASAAMAQTGRIEGTARDINTGDPIANARVVIVGTDLAGTTNANGYYAIDNVPAGNYEVRVNVIGYQQVTITNQTVASGLPTVVNFSLAQSILRLEGVVVTGVAEAQQAVKLPFTVDQIKGEDLEVPMSNAEEAIRGKVAGATVVRGSGEPGTGISVLLRGMTSLTQSNEPLYVVDGVILGSSMVDVDALNIESIEVVKGAAASALYGSRAANGVVQIRTQRGRNLPEGETRITFRSEFGRSSLTNKLQPAQHTSWAVSADGTQWLDNAGNPTDDRNLVVPDEVCDATTGGCWTFMDNVFPRQTNTGSLVDHWDEFYRDQNFYTNTLTVAHRTGSTNFLASFSGQKEGGIIRFLDGYKRNSARVNIDHRLGRTIDFSASGYYSRSTRDDPSSSDNPFYNIAMYKADVTLDTLYPTADFCASNPTDDGCLGGNWSGPRRDEFDYVIQPDVKNQESNPLYQPANSNDIRDRGRLLGNFRLRWRPADWFDFEGDFSYDRSDQNRTNYVFKGYRSADGQGPVNGQVYKWNGNYQAINGSLTATFTKRFGELNTVTRLRMLAENQDNFSFNATANNLIVNDVITLDAGTSDEESIGSSSSQIKSLGYFGSLQLDFKDRFIVDGLIRRDGSSLFGVDNRWRTYYRIAGAWRMAQEPWWPISGIDEFKIRAAQGTAGGRPGFSAQYEVFSIGGGTVNKTQLGNSQLVPELTKETEVGLDMILFGRLSLGITRAFSKVSDVLLSTPLIAVYGYTNQWNNAGNMKTATWEGTLQWQVLQKRSFGWNMNFVIDNTEMEITDFRRTPYKTGPGSLYYYRAGEKLGTMYGDRWATSCGDIAAKVSSADCSANFEVNDDGYLVYVGAGNTYTEGVSKGLWGTDGDIEDAGNVGVDTLSYNWGRPTKSWVVETKTLSDGTQVVDTTNYVPIGMSVPDINLGFGNNFRIGGFSIYALMDAQIGVDTYNHTRQYPYREDAAFDIDQSAKAEGNKKTTTYYQDLYNINAISSEFVESATYLKLRELSVRYTFNRSQLEGLFGGFIKRVSIGVIGRNLLTFTNYMGMDPEISSAGSASAYQRYDDFIYPHMRTFTGTVEIEF